MPAPNVAQTAHIELGGTWRALEANAELRRNFANRELDERDWEPLEVPGHWRSTTAFANSDGPLLYRRHFETRADPYETNQTKRSWLVLDGLFYQGDVWLNGAYLGDTEGYFIRHTFEATDALRSSHEHLLAIEATCAPQTNKAAKRNITGTFQHSDYIDPDWNPGGIWRPVRIEHTGPVRARSLRVLCTSADSSQATVTFRAELDSEIARQVTLRTTIAGLDDLVERPIASGSNFVSWTITIPEPKLWWPHALGDQPCHDLSVEVIVDGIPSHQLTRNIGLRSLAWKHMVLKVNGERLFLKGTSLAPTSMALGEASADAIAHDVHLAKEAGLDLLRVHGHISRPELYEAADQAGMLIWQDLPLHRGYARGIRHQATRQAIAAVDQLGHHPSIALWCGHNEPFARDYEPSWLKLSLRHAASQQLPTWNRTILDRAIKRVLEKADHTRLVMAYSGVLPHIGSIGSDTDSSFACAFGDERDFPSFCKSFPGLVRFVSKLGAEALPEDEQALVIRNHIETLRRLKYNPTGGFCHFFFADAYPTISSPTMSPSALDYERAPKASYHAISEACRPVIVVADRLDAAVSPGEPIKLDVHVVSDLRHPIESARVTARLTWPGGHQNWEWEGRIPVDSCVRVGQITTVAPKAQGEITLELTLDADKYLASNFDQCEIRPV